MACSRPPIPSRRIASRPCAQLGVPLAVRRVDARHAQGQSPEDAARRMRYATLASAAREEWGGEVKDIVLAQHADDQVETLLLALSRGAGLPGLSADACALAA
jgi:tRNA(Ile)-lysidine synthase